MIDVYLCDDEPLVRQQIQLALERKILIEGWDMEIVCSANNPMTLLDTLMRKDSRQGIYFLDVDLKNKTWDGFLLGQEIRRMDPHATLVYITSYGNLAYRTFQYHLEAFDYIIKDPKRLEQSVSLCLEAVQTRLTAERRNPKEVFTLRTGDMIQNIPLNDIFFFETAPTPHHILLYTVDGWIDFLGNLNELEAQLGERFLRIHRAYLVAADKIEKVDMKHGKLWIGARECLISRAGKTLLRKKMGGGL
ncbi:MAG: response regulator transcription factor [Oscillospiraceae bacterium]|jgi:two-component system response regulator AgrA|nr:response regulator transcription factor [Oscillospiraceae bacterium]